MTSPYQICSNCVMDTTDPQIYFDEKGLCNHCCNFERNYRPNWFPNKEGVRLLQKKIQEIKAHGKGKKYDCIIGLSGGVDSSYLALKIKDFGLRPLVIHVDAGWNSEIAVKNIECIVKYCNYDLVTHVINWEDMKQLQLAYLRSGIANQDIPQDHIFFSALYHFAVENDIRYVLTGSNIVSESIMPKAWMSDAMDSKNLNAIFKRFGHGKLQDYKTISFLRYYFYYPFIRRMKVVKPLDYLPYNKKEAILELEEKIGWRSYGEKHCESVFTKFFQNYFLPVRFNYDKRKPHFSSLILSGQMTRGEALKKLKEPLYYEKELCQDKLYIAKKLGLSLGEFEVLMKIEVHHFSDFPSNYKKYIYMKKIQAVIEKYFGKIGNY